MITYSISDINTPSLNLFRDFSEYFSVYFAFIFKPFSRNTIQTFNIRNIHKLKSNFYKKINQNCNASIINRNPNLNYSTCPLCCILS